MGGRELLDMVRFETQVGGQEHKAILTILKELFGVLIIAQSIPEHASKHDQAIGSILLRAEHALFSNAIS